MTEHVQPPRYDPLIRGGGVKKSPPQRSDDGIKHDAKSMKFLNTNHPSSIADLLCVKTPAYLPTAIRIG